jgi:hypothetical protein
MIDRRDLPEAIYGALMTALASLPIVVLLMAALMRPSFGRDAGQWEATDADVRKWYRELMQPENPSVSCCGEADAYHADSFVVENGTTIAIITDTRDDGPLGRPHIEPGTRIAVARQQAEIRRRQSHRARRHLRSTPAGGFLRPLLHHAGWAGITATTFADATVAYSGVKPGWNDRPGVALPYRFHGPRPRVRVWKDGRSVDCDIIDVGPWYDNRNGWAFDSYWQTGARPRAESDSRTNHAGIDLTPAADHAIGLNGKGVVDWEFIQESSMTDTTLPAPVVVTMPPTQSTNDKVRNWVHTAFAGILTAIAGWTGINLPGATMRWATVKADSLNVHAEAGGAIVDTLMKGEKVRVIGGPTPHKLKWWQIESRHAAGVLVGWVAEGDGKTVWLEVEAEEPPKPVPYPRPPLMPSAPVPKPTQGWQVFAVLAFLVVVAAVAWWGGH